MVSTDSAVNCEYGEIINVDTWMLPDRGDFLDPKEDLLDTYDAAPLFSEKELARGRRYRRLADSITYSRTLAMAVVAANVAFDDKIIPGLETFTLESAGVVGALGVLDKTDGMAARKAQSLGIEITDYDKKKDPFHDKIFTHSMMLALTIRAIQEKRYGLATVIAGNQAVTAIRDHKMTKSREEAVNGAEVGAIWINKLKTGGQNLGHTIATSPAANTIPGQFLIGATYSASTVLGWIGYRKADKMHKTPKAA